MKSRKQDTKGFSLIELIIVMAVMAILVGIVGASAVSYMEKARESKDRQVLSGLATAAVSAYTMNAEAFPPNYNNLIYFDFDDRPNGGYTKDPELSFYQDFVELSGFENANAVKDAMASKKGETVTFIGIVINLEDGEIAVYAYGLTEGGGVGDMFDPITVTI